MSKSSRRVSSSAVKLTTINEHFQCGICYGYITDATTITECLHSFCKPCIFHFFGTIDHRCPTCNTSVPDVNECIRSDSQLQRLIYNMVPGLLKEELAKREKYFESTSDTELALNRNSWVNLKLFNEQIKSSHSSGHQRMYVRYVQCLAETPVGIISKLIRNKHSVPLHYKIKLFHEGQLLKDTETLLEAFTSFIVDKDETFDIKYEIKKIKHRKSLKNIENKIPFKSSPNETTTSGPSPAKRRKENIKTESPLQPLSAQVDESINDKKSTQLPSPTQSTSTSSSSSTRLKNTDFLRVKFRRSSSNSKSKKRAPAKKQPKSKTGKIESLEKPEPETIEEEEDHIDDMDVDTATGYETAQQTTSEDMSGLVEDIEASENSNRIEKSSEDELSSQAKEIVNEIVGKVENTVELSPL